GTWQQVKVGPLTNVGAEVLIEVVFELERGPALSWIGGVERRGRVVALEPLDDPGRVADVFSVDLEHGHLALTRHLLDASHVRSGEQRPPDVRYALVVQRPTRLLRIVRDHELPEDGSVHEVLLANVLAMLPRARLRGSSLRVLRGRRVGTRRAGDIARP